jgi:type IV pilus assembly protein PilB
MADVQAPVSRRRGPTAAPEPDDNAKKLARAARRLGYEYVESLAGQTIDEESWDLVPHTLIRRHKAIPIGRNGKAMRIAVSDPSNVIALDDFRTMSGLELEVLVVRPEEIDELISRLEKLDHSAQEFLEEAAKNEEESLDDHEFGADEAPIVKAINRIITTAVQQRASDIHIEPQQKDIRIRFRIDGVLTEAMRTKKTLHAGVISRLKVMADLDIAEKRIPQDGRVTVSVDKRAVDLRVATLPTSWGEKCVLRILDHSEGVRDLGDLGFTGPGFDVYQKAVARPHGAVLITGPTGSGKSTTLYATLAQINTVDRNIVTVEDPVEARLAGISQIQVNPRAGLTFATALRSILRADPDVLMVGEMRDRETALIGIEAALTGHLVFATLHTNDAASAINRLVEMGIETFLVASAVECIVAQRLARKLCTKCAETYKPSPDVLENEGFPWKAGDPIPILKRPVGCPACANTGYRGRLAVLEVLQVTDAIRGLTVERSPAEVIKRQAIADGMRTLREDGLSKALEGLTSVEEVLRVVA